MTGRIVHVFNKGAASERELVYGQLSAMVEQRWVVEDHGSDGSHLGAQGPFNNRSSAMAAAERLVRQANSNRPDHPARLEESVPPPTVVESPRRDDGLSAFLNAGGFKGVQNVERARELLRAAAAPAGVTEAAGSSAGPPPGPWEPRGAMFELYVRPHIRQGLG